MPSRWIASLALSFLSLAACGSPPPELPPLCDSDFRVTVRSGPSAGLDLNGKLALVLQDPAHISGTFTTSASETSTAKFIRVTGSVQNNTISIALATPQGTITGTGPFPTANLSCPVGTMVQGSFTGPMAGDSGDWLGTLTKLYLKGLAVSSDLGPYACFAGCSYLGESDSYCNGLCGTNN